MGTFMGTYGNVYLHLFGCDEEFSREKIIRIRVFLKYMRESDGWICKIVLY